MKEYRKPFRDFFIIFFFSCLIYFPLLGNKAKNPDATITLPSLFSVSSPFEYLKMLSEFQVVDFQPVRDLTFFWDIAFYKLTGVITFATTNIILWAIACYLFLKLLRRTSPQNELSAIYWTLAFTSYPLFSQAVPWGMARKHILAFLLILWTTHAFIDWCEGKKSIFKVYAGYVLACLSHPIILLWPLWAACYLAMFSPEKLKAEKKTFVVFLFAMTALLVTNYAYYTIGNKAVFDNYSEIRPDFFDLPRMIINFLFYIRQMFFPYQLGFLYYPEITTAFPGIFFCFLILVAVYKFRKDRSFIPWLIFSILPFPIILTLPGVFDQYLLIPVACVVIVAFNYLGKYSKRSISIVVVLLLLWSTFTYQQAKLWVNPVLLSERNFRNAPSCKSAGDFAQQTYLKGQKVPIELLNFITTKNCFLLPPGSPQNLILAMSVIESMMLFYEDRFPYEYREKRLLQLGQGYYLPLLIYATLKATEDNSEEVEKIAGYLFHKAGSIRLETGHIVDGVLRPYCLRKKLESCIKITVPYNEEPPYL